MPDQLKVHPGERVDLVDYVQGANTFTQDSQKFLIEREMLDRRSRVLDGFRIRVEDQTANPGMITVYNGHAIDRNGQLINNEQQVNDSRSITLLGANLNFYVEIEFILNDSSVDARFLWDPTTPNTPPEPDGSEFGLNVATRMTPDWRIVSPVSTTSFQQTSNANSIRVPVGVFRTDGANRIVTGGTNPGLVFVRAASVLENDILVGASSFRVIDARIFPATTPFNITLDFGGTTPEALTVSGVDRDNGIVTVTAPIAANHSAGAIVRVTSGTADLVREKTDPSDPALDSLAATPGHPDLAQRLWQANEVRGSGLMQSKETFGARDDLNIRSLKDEIDFLSAQIRELKFGHARPEVVSTAPPSSFATRPRYFDRVGSVAGARASSVSIGNGTTTFGDFNGTDGSALVTAAVAALPASGGTIFVKAGTYNFASTVSIAKPVVFVGEHYQSTVFNSTNAGGAAISTTSNLRFVNLTQQRGGGAAVNILDVAGAVNINFDYCVFVGQLRLVNVNVGIIATNTSFTASSSLPIVNGSTVTATLTLSNFNNCLFVSGGTIFTCAVDNVRLHHCNITAATILNPLVGACNANEFYVRDSLCTVAFSVVVTNATSGAVTGCTFENNRINCVSLGSGQGVFYLANTGTIDRVHIRNNYFNVTGGVSTEVFPGYIVYVENNTSSADFRVENNQVDAFAGSAIVPVSIDQDTLVGRCSVSDNYFFRTLGVVRLGGTVGALDSGELSVVHNYHDNAGEHANVRGVILVNNPRPDALNVLDNTFVNYTSLSLGTRVGVDLTTSSTTVPGMVATVRGNKFLSLADISAGSGSAFGVLYDAATTSVDHQFEIHDNFFYLLAGDLASAAVRLVNTAATNTMIARVSRNRIHNVGDVGPGNVVANAFGIYLQGFTGTATSPSAQVCENSVYRVKSATGSNVGSGIELLDCSNAVVSNNYVASIRSLLSSGSPALQSGCGIRVAGSGNNYIVTGNIVDQSLSSTPGESTIGILVRSTGTMSGVLVSGNVLRSSTSTEIAGGFLWVLSNTSSVGFVNTKVVDNVIAWRATSVSGVGLFCGLGGPSYNVSVGGNIVENTTYSASVVLYVGIDINCFNSGGTPRSVSVVGNHTIGPKTGALLTGAGRIGIRLRGFVNHTLVSNNLIDWNEPGVLEGIGIKYGAGGGAGGGSGHLCTGNYIRADNSAAAGGEVDIDTAVFLNGYLVANQLGQGAGNVGTVVPGVVAGGWDYGAGTGGGTYLGLNKLS